MKINDIFSGERGVFFIAEAGCNYEGDFNRAMEMVKTAAWIGADAIKFQTFIPERLVTRDAPKFWDIEGCSGETQFEEFKETHQMSREEYISLKEIADSKGITLFSTPSDEKSADMLGSVGVPLYKISSMDITHIPLIRHIARKGKPVILSTGASTMDEVWEAVNTIEDEGNRRIGILHCTTNYPTRPENVNLNMMKTLMEEFPTYPVGYSDHTSMSSSTHTILAAVAAGARIIEKHFTFDKTRPGYDHAISASYFDTWRIIKIINTTMTTMGISEKRPTESEEKARMLARRSIVAEVYIPSGATITADMVAIKRPGTGIPPKYINTVVGKKAKDDIPEDSVITWEMVTR